MDILFIAKMIGYTLQFDWKLIFSQASFCSFNRCSELKIFLRLLTHKKHHFYKHHAIYFRANQAKTTATMKRLHNCCTINKEVKWNLKIKKKWKLDSPKKRNLIQNVFKENFPNTMTSLSSISTYFYFLWRFQNIYWIVFTEDLWTPNPWPLNLAKCQKISDLSHWDLSSTVHFSQHIFVWSCQPYQVLKKLSRALIYQTNLTKQSDMLQTLFWANLVHIE